MQKKLSGNSEGSPGPFTPGSRPRPWEAVSGLFPPFPPMPELELLPQALERVWPLNAKHRKSLPRDIGELSQILTCQRGRMAFPYWQKPNFVSAYLYYFLPWNLLRLLRLFRGLRLPQPQNGACLLDAGSGPLTLPLALFLARPQWRSLPITIVALDSVKIPLYLGANLFREMASLLGAAPWSLKAAVAPLEALPRHLPQGTSPWLVTAANALNEMREQSSRHGPKDGEDEHRERRLGALLEAWRPLWQRAPLLVAEPGTRLGGDTIEQLRAIALELGLKPLAPCTHASACPLLGDRKRWCHFVFSAQDAPGWLKRLSREARLFKTSLSLSPLYLAGEQMPSRGNMPIRVISQPFEVAGQMARYGCASCGLCLLPDAAPVLSGSFCLGQLTGQTDAHSGAQIVVPAAETPARKIRERDKLTRPESRITNQPAPQAKTRIARRPGK